MESAQNSHYIVHALAGGTVLECFLDARTFFESDGTPCRIFSEAAGGPRHTFSEEHSHACYELLVCRRGQGFQFVNGAAREYSPNSIFLFAPYTPHAHISDAAQGDVRYSIRFELPDKPLPELEGGEITRQVFTALHQRGFFDFVAGPEAVGIIDMVAEEVKRGSFYTPLMLEGLLSALFACVYRELHAALVLQKGTAPGSWQADSVINKRRFLIDHFFDHLIDSNAKMEELCRQVHLSPSQLNRVIREMFGTTFKQKLIEVRIAYIKYFLQYSDLSITEIAQRTNFPEDSNFSLFFKQHCGMSPSAYRQACRTQKKASLPQ